MRSSDKAAIPTQSVMTEVSGEMLNEGQNVVKEVLLRYVQAEQLRYLIEHDNEPNAGLEPSQDWR
jgi:hypothetical protein